jgi:hypothetical protein
MVNRIGDLFVHTPDPDKLWSRANVVVIGTPYVVKGESELVDCKWVDGYPVEGTGRVLTHPDWTCVPCVEECVLDDIRRDDVPDHDTFNQYYGGTARIILVDAAHLTQRADREHLELQGAQDRDPMIAALIEIPQA